MNTYLYLSVLVLRLQHFVQDAAKIMYGDSESRTWQEGLAISGLQFARNLPNYTGKGFRTDACTSEAAIYVPGYTRPFQ